MRPTYDRYLARDRRGLYESHYLKANSPDGTEALWIKHNVLVPREGGGIAEFWLIHFQLGQPPRVWKREVPFGELVLGAEELSLRGDAFRLDHEGCEGRIADASWRFSFSGGLPPMFHYGAPIFYRGAFPKKKILTPTPNLVFDGALTIGDQTTTVAKWVGLRGHNWGTEHAHTYVYGGCNVWDDGAADRAIDGFTARIKIAGMLTPWLSSLVFRGEQAIDHNRVRDWIRRDAVVEPRRWRLPYADLELDMTGEPGEYAGLRYRHPSGAESYCYNNKLARVRVTAAGRTYTSRCGEHEVLYPEPLPDVPLHPSAGWSQRDGDYRSR
ncbi:MAG: hypothetical protein ABI591_06305 [Kofleriaceae bacterium]